MTDYLPIAEDSIDPVQVQEALAVIRPALDLYRRTSGSDSTRVMVVGDSQARSIGFGLERYEADHDHDVVVWNLANPGCGLLDDGVVIDLLTDEPAEPDPACATARENWSENVATYDPDLVIVLSSLRDIQDRQLPGWEGFKTIGEAEMDEHLLDRYGDVVETLTAHGATVIWLEAPCVKYKSAFGGSARAPRAFQPERLERLNELVTEDLVDAKTTDLQTFDLDAVLCPTGQYVEDIGGLESTRPDGIHPSLEGALWLAEVLHREVIEPNQD